MPDYSSLITPTFGSAIPPVPIGQIDYGVFDPTTGKVVSLKTKKPWNGVEPRTGKKYANGVEVPAGAPGTPAGGIDPNDVSQRYKAVEVTKDPGVASAADQILKDFQTNADAALKDFNAHLSDYNKALNEAITTSKAATDIGPLENVLRNQQSQYAKTIGNTSTNYQNTLNDISKQYAGANADAIARERAQVAALQATTPQFDAAVGNIENVATQNIMKQLSRDQARSGLPVGSDLAGATARQLAAALTPWEREKIANQQNIITGTALPEEQRITGLETNRISQFLPSVAQSQYAAGTSTAGSQYTTARDVELAVQNFKQAAAQGNWQLVLQMLQVPELAAELRQRIQSGDVQLLGALAQIRDQSAYRGLQDKLGANLLQPQYFPMSQPGFPNPSPLTGPRAPRQVSPSTPAPEQPPGTNLTDSPNNPLLSNYLNSILGNPPSDLVAQGPAPRFQLDRTGNGYFDSETGEWFPLGQPAVTPVAPATADLSTDYGTA